MDHEMKYFKGKTTMDPDIGKPFYLCGKILTRNIFLAISWTAFNCLSPVERLLLVISLPLKTIDLTKEMQSSLLK